MEIERGKASRSGDAWKAMSETGVVAGEKTIINEILLRFRPIAPKPSNGGQVSSTENNNLFGSKRRTKRKYVRVCKGNNRGKNINKVSSDPQPNGAIQNQSCDLNEVVTLELLPGSSSVRDTSTRETQWCNLDHGQRGKGVLLKQPVVNGFDRFGKFVSDDQTVETGPIEKVESWVTVECVTDTYTCMDLGGCTDWERMKKLESDTCPGFISDGSNNVKWVNEAYKKMVTDHHLHGNLHHCGSRNHTPQQRVIVTVRLVINEKLMPYLNRNTTFTCWVRIKDRWKKESGCQLVPCDVWRMDFGGFAWRLDVEAALGLGRLTSL